MTSDVQCGSLGLSLKSLRDDLFIAHDGANLPAFCFSAPNAFGAEKQKEKLCGVGLFYKQVIPTGLTNSACGKLASLLFCRHGKVIAMTAFRLGIVAGLH